MCKFFKTISHMFIVVCALALSATMLIGFLAGVGSLGVWWSVLYLAEPQTAGTLVGLVAKGVTVLFVMLAFGAVSCTGLWAIYWDENLEGVETGVITSVVAIAIAGLFCPLYTMISGHLPGIISEYVPYILAFAHGFASVYY